MSSWDIVLVTVGTQFLARRPIWDTVIGTQPSLHQFDLLPSARGLYRGGRVGIKSRFLRLSVRTPLCRWSRCPNRSLRLSEVHCLLGESVDLLRDTQIRVQSRINLDKIVEARSAPSTAPSITCNKRIANSVRLLWIDVCSSATFPVNSISNVGTNDLGVISCMHDVV